MSGIFVVLGVHQCTKEVVLVFLELVFYWGRETDEQIYNIVSVFVSAKKKMRLSDRMVIFEQRGE